MSTAILDLIAATSVMAFTQPSVDAANPSAGNLVSGVEAPATVGAAATPTVTTIANVPGVLPGHFLFDFYYRIWVIPQTINAQNPSIGAPIPFAIWNAYPQPLTNTLTSIADVAGDGLEFDFDVGDVWKAIEYKVVNITITPAAPIEIAAEFTFSFSSGSEKLFFNASIADFVQMVPDPPVEETWAWLTDIIPARDGTEQRIALRSTPRRSIKYAFVLENEFERRRQYNRWYKSLASRIVLPYYQYSTPLTAGSSVGSSSLYFDPARTDLRDGEFALVYDALTDNGYLVKIDTVEVDGVTTDTPLTFEPSVGMVIAPAFTSRLLDKTGLSMYLVTGKVDLAAEALNSRVLFSRPGSTAVINTYDGYPVLDIRPIGTGETPELFQANYEVVDGETGIQAIYSAWPHPAVHTTRQYTIRRLQNPGEMDWWRDFLGGLYGQREPFLQPTWFPDLYLASAPAPGDPGITITGSDYVSLYFPYDAFKRLQLETAAGIIWRKVLTAVDNGDGTSTLTFDTPIGGTPDDATISRISYLNLVRLSSDTITLSHGRIRTQIELPTRTVDV